MTRKTRFFTRIFALLLVFITCMSALALNASADGDVPDPQTDIYGYCNYYYTQLALLQAGNGGTAKARDSVEKYTAKLSELLAYIGKNEVDAAETAAQVDLYYQKGLAVNDVAWIYENNLTYITEYAASLGEGEENLIENAFNGIETKIDDTDNRYAWTADTLSSAVSASGYASGLRASMFVAIYEQKLDDLLQTGDSSEVKGKITLALDEMKKLNGDDTAVSSTRYDEILADAASKTATQRVQDTVLAELEEVFAILCPNDKLEDVEAFYAARKTIDEDTTTDIADMNKALEDAIVAFLATKVENRNTHVSAYIDALSASVAAKTQAVDGAAADYSDAVKDFDLGYAKAQAKDKVDGLFASVDDTEFKPGLVDNVRSLIDACESEEQIGTELEKAELRRDLLNDYLDAAEKIGSYGLSDTVNTLDGDNAEKQKTFAEQAKEKYKNADTLINGSTNYAEQYNDGVAALAKLLSQAEAQNYLNTHSDILNKTDADLTEGDLEALDGAVSDALSLSDEAKAILHTNRVFDSIEEKYKQIATDKINGLLEGELANGEVKDRLLGDVNKTSVTTSDAAPAELKKISEAARDAIRKAEEIKKIQDRLDKTEQTDEYAGFSETDKQDIAALASDAQKSIYDGETESADTAVDDLARAAAKAYINAKVAEDTDISESTAEAVEAIADTARMNVESAKATDERTLEEVLKEIADGTVTELEKQFVLDEVTSYADGVKTDIDNLTFITDKTTPTENIDEILGALADSLAECGADGIEAAKEIAVKGIDGILAEATAADKEAENSQKEAALEELREQRDALKEQINALKYLDDEAKDAYTKDGGEIDKAFDTAAGSINGAASTDDVTAALNEGRSALDGIGTAATDADGQAQTDKKNNAKKELKDAYDALTEQIEALPFVEDKSQLENDAKDSYDEAVAAIDGAESKEGVADAANEGKAALGKVSSDAAAADGEVQIRQKSVAKGALEAKHGELIGIIDGFTFLDDELKNGLKNDADTALENALSNVDGAENTGDVDKAVSDGGAALDKVKTNGEWLDKGAEDSQKKTAKDELDSKKNETVQGIDSLPYLDADEKKALVDEAQKALDDALAGIDGAAGTDDVARIKDGGVSELDKTTRDAEARNLDGAKKSAAEEAEAARDEAKSAVDELTYLDDAQRDELVSELDEILAQGKSDIASAQSTDRVSEIKSALLGRLSDKSEEAKKLDDDACVDRLTPVIVVLGIIGGIELIAIGVLLLTRKRNALASFVPFGMLAPAAIKLAPTSAWTLTGVLAAADVIMAVIIVALIVARIKARPAPATVAEPVPEAEPIPEPVSEPEPEEIPEVVESVTVEEANELMTDEDALKHEETDFNDTEVYTGRKKAEINIDTISRSFEAGDTVTLNSLKEKGLVPKQAGCVKVLARGTLDKPLTVIAQSYSVAAVKMIVLTGGTAIVTHGSSEREG